ncbi:MAG: rRNA biogenesis protein rrp36 [Watsoniomyces obsoletus]|nr:MAG: rRNA biogenesis protein rrp36 [Watsoniomyces obsoletus]
MSTDASPKQGADDRLSPRSARTGPPPKIIVKKEPAASPEISTARHRPRKLDLSKGGSSSANPQPLTSRTSANPLTAREGGGGGGGATAGLGMQDVGLACLSPGFLTQDPTMREQLQRSISVRDQQRHIIESRLQRSAKPGEGSDGPRLGDGGNGNGGTMTAGLKTPSSRRKPPPGLSIVAPPHEQFAHERVIQSAPLHQSFPGRHQPEPLTRHVANQPSNLGTSSHIHHVRAMQTDNRLPPIMDVLGGHRERYLPPAGSNANSAHSASQPHFPSPGHPPPPPPPPSHHQQHHHHSQHPQQHQAAQQQQQQPNQQQSSHLQQPPSSAGRPREYRSAEEAVASMSGGREDLLPKIIHYGGHQPPTPPSPLNTGGGGGGGPVVPPHKLTHSYSSGDITRNDSGVGIGGGILTGGGIGGGGGGAGRRRTRVEYERDMSSPPLGSGPDHHRRGPFGEGRDSPETQRKKKDEFLSICARAWDLFHT